MSICIDKLIEKLLEPEPKILEQRELRWLCEKAKEILLEESNVQPVAAPVVICGDIHG